MDLNTSNILVDVNNDNVNLKLVIVKPNNNHLELISTKKDNPNNIGI